jgi:hypothetical protein
VGSCGVHITLSFYPVGAQLSEIHGFLCQPPQWQKIDMVVPVIQRRIGDELLQKQIHFAGKITFSF